MGKIKNHKGKLALENNNTQYLWNAQQNLRKARLFLEVSRDLLILIKHNGKYMNRLNRIIKQITDIHAELLAEFGIKHVK